MNWRKVPAEVRLLRSLRDWERGAYLLCCLHFEKMVPMSLRKTFCFLGCNTGKTLGGNSHAFQRGRERILKLQVF